MGHFSNENLKNQGYDREDASMIIRPSNTLKDKQDLLKKRQFLEERRKYIARFGNKNKTYEREREEDETSDLEYGSRH